MRSILYLLCAVLVTVGSSARGQAQLFQSATTVAPTNRIDGPVLQALSDAGIQPASNCTDSAFLRRVFIDVIGTLPTEDEARAFLEDLSPDKRTTLIDALLGRPEFADYWALKWCDMHAGQVRVPDQYVAQRGAGLPLLGPRQHPAEQAL